MAQRVQMADVYPPLFCDPCRKVHVLSPENAAAFAVYLNCESQQIRSDGVLLGLDHRAIRDEIEAQGHAEDGRVTYRKVLAAERELVKWSAEERERIEREREAKRKADR